MTDDIIELPTRRPSKLGRLLSLGVVASASIAAYDHGVAYWQQTKAAFIRKHLEAELANRDWVYQVGPNKAARLDAATREQVGKMLELSSQGLIECQSKLSEVQFIVGGS